MFKVLTHTYYFRILLFTATLLTLFCTNGIHAQKIYLPKTDTLGNIYFYHFDKNQAYSHHKRGDTVQMHLQLPAHKKAISLFPGNAEINILHVKDTVIYSGKYMDKTKVYNNNDHYFLVIPPSDESQIVELTSYNLSTLDFYMAPYITSQESLEFHITRFVLEGQVGIFIAIGFVGGIFVLIIFFTLSYTLNRRVRDHYYYILYLLSILIFNSVQLDSFLRFYLLFPKNPIIYHQIFDFTSLLTYVVFILVIIKFLDLEKLNKKLANRARLLTFVMFLGSLVVLISGLLKEFHFLKNEIVFIYVLSLMIGGIIISDILYHVKSRLAYLSMIGCTFLLIGIMIEFVTSSLLEDSYFWNLERPFLGQIFPVNFTHFGIWIHLIFLAMIIGYKYKKTDISTLEMHQSNLEELKQNSKLEQRKMIQLAQTLSEQKDYLIQKNKVFDFLQTKVGEIKQQLNPDFIENMFHSISLNIDVKQNDLAKKQIRLLKDFLNHIIECSDSNLILLKDDMKILKSFIELEKIRLHQKLKFYINVVNFQVEDYYIPPFLFQEYIENIIWNNNENKHPSYHTEIELTINKKYAEIKIIESSAFDIKKNHAENQRIINRIQERLENNLSSEFQLNYEVLNDPHKCRLILKIMSSDQLG